MCMETPEALDRCDRNADSTIVSHAWSSMQYVSFEPAYEILVLLTNA